jgi:hypothetical protein
LRKTAAIFFIAILLFNIAGYRFIFNYLEKQSTAKLEKQIDAGNYAADQLIEVKVPLNIHYAANTDYGPSYGETEFNGQHYRYVQRKVQMDTLYLLCIPHNAKDQLIALKSDFEKQQNDPSSLPGKGKATTLKLLLSEFVPEKKYSFDLSFYSGKLQSRFRNIRCFSQSSPSTGEQPPEALS